MEFIKRKVFLTKNLVPYDSDNDGQPDSLTLSATTKNILVPLTTSYDDIGIYDLAIEDEVEIIDIGGIFDETIDPNDVTQPKDPLSGVTSNWGSGELPGQGEAGQPQNYAYCSDPQSPNYQSIQYIGTFFGVSGTDSQIITQLSDLGVTLIQDQALCSAGPTGGFGSGEQEQGGYFVGDAIWLYTTDNTGPNTPSPCPSCYANCEAGAACKPDGYYCKCGCCAPGGKTWTTSSWNSFESTARARATIYCFSIGKQLIPSALSTHPSLQGDANSYDGSTNTTPWADIKQRTTDNSGNFGATKSQTCCTDWIDVKDNLDTYNAAVAAGIITDSGAPYANAYEAGWCAHTAQNARERNWCCGTSTNNYQTRKNYRWGFFCVN